MSIHEAERAERGFTLIELLVVVAIIGILAAIAIPFFSTYRATSFDSHAAQALNTLAKAEEAYFARNGNYAANVMGLPAYYPPNGVVVNLGTVSVSGFTAQSHHPEGTRTYTWDSSNGGLQP